ncbi:MAG: hypothetical protein LBD18_07680, partial [Treponema sp.]|nr:hypothetical protein [Treponema sp.]
MKQYFFTGLAAFFLAASCQTMKGDLSISSPREQMELNLMELERMVVALDKNEPDKAGRQTAMAAARKMAG